MKETFTKDSGKQTHEDNRSKGRTHAAAGGMVRYGVFSSLTVVGHGPRGERSGRAGRAATPTQNETYLPVHETIEEKRLTFLQTLPVHIEPTGPVDTTRTGVWIDHLRQNWGGQSLRMLLDRFIQANLKLSF